MRDSLRGLLLELTALPGIAGHEQLVGRHLASLLREVANGVMVDSLGNVSAHFGAESGRRVAVLAHMDTIGFLVKRINADGTLGMVPVGGVNLKALPGAAVRVDDRPGVIGVRSQHLAQAGDEVVGSADALYIDVGPGPSVEITTPVTYGPQMIMLGDSLIASPYLDNRAGCATLVELARQLAGQAADTVYLVGTAQEETTCAGAYYALQAIQPDAAIFVDATVSYDTPDTRGRGSVMLGAGPVLTSYLYTSGHNAWHAHPVLRAHARHVAAAEGIPFQQDAVHGLMSDARVVTWLGIPSILVAFPLRGKHAPLETLHLEDLVNTVRLLLTLLNRPLPYLI